MPIPRKKEDSLVRKSQVNAYTVAVLEFFFLCAASISKSPVSDADECAYDPSPCHANASCANSIGSYVCSCNEGFTGDGKECTGRLLNNSLIGRLAARQEVDK